MAFSSMDQKSSTIVYYEVVSGTTFTEGALLEFQATNTSSGYLCVQKWQTNGAKPVGIAKEAVTSATAGTIVPVELLEAGKLYTADVYLCQDADYTTAFTSAGTTTTAIDATNWTGSNDTMNGAWISIKKSDGSFEGRRINDFTSADDTATFNVALSSATATSDYYTIIKFGTGGTRIVDFYDETKIYGGNSADTTTSFGFNIISPLDYDPSTDKFKKLNKVKGIFVGLWG